MTTFLLRPRTNKECSKDNNKISKTHSFPFTSSLAPSSTSSSSSHSKRSCSSVNGKRRVVLRLAFIGLTAMAINSILTRGFQNQSQASIDPTLLVVPQQKQRQDSPQLVWQASSSQVAAIADMAKSASASQNSSLLANDTDSLRRELPDNTAAAMNNMHNDDKRIADSILPHTPFNSADVEKDVGKNRNSSTEDQTIQKRHDDKKSIAVTSDFNASYQNQLALVTQADPTQRSSEAPIADTAASASASPKSNLLPNDNDSISREPPETINSKHNDDKKSPNSVLPSIPSNITDSANNVNDKNSITEDQTIQENNDGKKSITVTSNQEQLAMVTQADPVQPSLPAAVADNAVSGNASLHSTSLANDTESLPRELPDNTAVVIDSNQNDDKKIADSLLPSIPSKTDNDNTAKNNNIRNDDQSIQENRHDKNNVVVKNTDFDLSYEEQLALVTRADPTQKTLAFAPFQFFSGFINEVMAFSAFIMYAYDNNFTQVLLPSLRWKDLFGTGQLQLHEFLFDVVHWNQYYATTPTIMMTSNVLSLRNITGPNENSTHSSALLQLQQRPPLPRLVAYHPSMTDLRQDGNKFYWRGDRKQATLPFACEILQGQFFIRYRRHRRLNNSTNRHVSDLAILQGALRPHPRLQQLVDLAKESMVPVAQAKASHPTAVDATAGAGSRARGDGGYLCLHARIEPDMQKHPVCRDQKVTSLRQILDGIYGRYPVDSPPPNVNRVLIVLYRKLLEDENHEQNTLAKENLDLLNQLRSEGMWNGTIPVYEAGSHFLPPNSKYNNAPSIAGSILNYHLALDAQIFIGSPVSSFAMQVMATRYHRYDLRHQSSSSSSSSQPLLNYMYLPTGLELLPTHKEPPPFGC